MRLRNWSFAMIVLSLLVASCGPEEVSRKRGETETATELWSCSYPSVCVQAGIDMDGNPTISLGYSPSCPGNQWVHVRRTPITVNYDDESSEVVYEYGEVLESGQCHG